MDISSLFGASYQIRWFRRILLVISLVIAFYSLTLHATRVSDKIYSVLQSNHYCSRRLNATNQMGCTSELGGNVGVLWVVEKKNDLDHLMKTGPTPPYIAVLRPSHYTRRNLLDFKANPDRVVGVVFLDENHDDSKLRPSLFSPDDTCPNRYSGLYVNDTTYEGCRQNHWQRESPVSTLLYEDIPYPIFLINEKESINEIDKCFRNNYVLKGEDKKQDSYPLCSMQLDSFMLAASDTKTCLNSHSLVDELLQSNGQRCYTVENQNIFAYYKPTYGPLHPNEGTDLMSPDLVEPQSVVLLIAKLSSFSMFSDISPGADSTITSIVTLLAVAEALGKVRNSTKVINSPRNIAFALLDSEPFDYTGSSRMVFSMKNNSFPNRYFRSRGSNMTTALRNINLASLDYVINLDQLANYPNSSTVYMHSDPRAQDNKKLKEALRVFNEVASKEKVKFLRADPTLPLPPTPVHEFIKESRISSPQSLLGLVLSNYEKTYSNLFYNSIYDDSHNVRRSEEDLIEHVSKVAGMIAKGLYQLAFESKETDEIKVDKKIVENLFECYMKHANCSLFTKAWQAGQQLPNGPIQTYKDPTKRSDDMNGAITYHLLAYFVGDKVEYNSTRCYEEERSSLIYSFQYVNGRNEPVRDRADGICIRSQVLTVPATSPAFDVTPDGISVNEKYPAWTVSLSSIRNPARLYLEPSPIQQWCVFLLGIVVTVMSFIVIHHIKSSISHIRDESDVQPGTST